MRLPPSLLVLASTTLVVAPAFAQSGYPFVRSLNPIAVQVGKTTECEVWGAAGNGQPPNLELASGAFVHGAQPQAQGVAIALADLPALPEGEARKPMDRRKVLFTVAADAMPGEREYRLITPKGPSSLGAVYVTRLPVVAESTPNDVRETATAVEWPVCVCGTFEKAEDIDFFKFTLAEPKAMSLVVHSSRLEGKTIDLLTHGDPILIVRNAGGQIVAQSDNYYGPDPMIHKELPAGEWFVEIRDVRYQGNASWQYAVEIDSRPVVERAIPASVPIGATTKVELQGQGIPPGTQVDLAIPADATPGLRHVVVDVAGGPSNPFAIFVGPAATLVEPSTDNNTAATAAPITIPAAIDRRLDTKGDLDCYVFEAKKDQRYWIETLARGAGSSIDASVRITNEQGGTINELDDGTAGRYRQFDPFIEWTAPSDGKFVVEIRDVRRRGGVDFPYRLQVTTSEPRFKIETDTDKTWIAPGVSAAIFVRAYRLGGFAGEIDLNIEGLPPGVTARGGKILADQKDGTILLTCAADAKPGDVSHVKVGGTAKHAVADGSQVSLSAVAQTLCELAAPGGPRSHWPAAVHTVSISAPGDLRKIKLSATDVVLKPGESRRIEVEIERREGYEANTELAVMYEHLGQIFGGGLPPGVTVDAAASRTLIGGKDTKGWITFKAAPDAKPVDKQLVPVLANCIVIFHLKTPVAADPFTITVASP